MIVEVKAQALNARSILDILNPNLIKIDFRFYNNSVKLSLYHKPKRRNWAYFEVLRC